MREVEVCVWLLEKIGRPSHQDAFKGGDWRECGVRLRNETDTFCDLRALQLLDVLFEEINVATLRGENAVDASEGRCLSRAVRSEEAEEFSLRDGKRNMLKNGSVGVIADGDMFKARKAHGVEKVP